MTEPTTGLEALLQGIKSCEHCGVCPSCLSTKVEGHMAGCAIGQIQNHFSALRAALTALRQQLEANEVWENEGWVDRAEKAERDLRIAEAENTRLRAGQQEPKWGEVYEHFCRGWHDGFQEALKPDVHPDQDRCAVLYKEYETELLAALASREATPEPPR